MIESHADSRDSRQIRVFLSSTFVDFMEERELLVKRVFPALNRRARDRGVELIDVDLRWGVTEEQTKQGQTLPLCLGEIDRCRPYFIGLLGERHGWVPPADFYKPELLERQPWLRQHQGGTSVTELEILHGVLRNPEMAGYARFYLRDPAYAQAQQDTTWLAEGEEERQRLQALKEQVRASRFPVIEDLPDPEAIVNRIETDLWELIEERFPEQEQPDALEQENRKHASYRQSRTGEGQYIGGGGYIQRLESWLEEGQQQILITGESGAGKSALIANWMQHHGQEHPSDVVYAHHLGCSNDSNVIRPLLGRMLDTASKLLKDAELITEPIQVPEDWWQLTAKVAETLLNLGRWCRNTGHRWIWVLDGLDRLTIEDQQALPWLPLFIPEGVSVMISALECPARAIVQERQFEQLEIGPLQRKEQEQLIENYLERYTKKLDINRLEQILTCDLASSPLFLRVLLEELRQCGRFETLEAQIAAYIGPKADGSLAVNDLYARVLVRLESDCGTEPVRKALTALWASRAGLSETELLDITGLAQLQWAPIDLALHKAFGRNGNRLVFDHDYLRIAVQDRYLSSEEAWREAHSDLANWFADKKDWDGRKAEELPWQLQMAGRLADLREVLLDVGNLYGLAIKRDDREVVNYWRTSRADDDGELDELVAEELEREIWKRRASPEDLMKFLAHISALFEVFGFYRNSLLRLRYLSVETAFRSCLKNHRSGSPEIKRVANSLESLSLFEDSGRFYEHLHNEIKSLSLHEKSEMVLASPQLFSSMLSLATAFSHIGLHGKATTLYSILSEIAESDPKERLTDDQKFDLLLEQAMLELKQYDAENNSVGDSDQPFLHRAEILLDKAVCYAKNLPTEVNPRILKANQLCLGIASRGYGMGKLNDAAARLPIDQWGACLGPNHPDTLEAEWLFAEVLSKEAQYKVWHDDDYETPRPEWVQSFPPIYKKYEITYGEYHPISISRMFDYANHCRNARLTEESFEVIRTAYNKSLRLLSQDHPTVSRIRRRYAYLLGNQGHHEASIDMLEKEYSIAKAKENEQGIFPVLACQINLVEAYIEAKLNYKANEYLVDLAFHSCVQRGCGDPITLHALLATSDLEAFPSQPGSPAIGCFYELIFAIRNWNIDNYFVLEPVSFNDLILLALGDSIDVESVEALLKKHILNHAAIHHDKPVLLLNDLSTVYWIKGDFSEAISVIRMVLETATGTYGESHCTTLRLLDKLGIYLRDAGMHDEAIEIFETTYQRRRDLFGDNGGHGVGYSKANIVRCMMDRGDSSVLAQFLQSFIDLGESRDDFQNNYANPMITALFSSYRFKKDISVMIKPFLVEPQALELNPIAVENVLAHVEIACSLSYPS